MPTSNNPPHSSNPHSEGELHQSEIQQKAAPQSLEEAVPNETSTEATTITSSLREKASLESISTANHTQKPEINNTPVEEKSNPQNSNKKKIDFCDFISDILCNFFSDNPKKNTVLFFLAAAVLGLIIGFLIVEYDISLKHLSESNRLLEKNHELSTEDTKEINSFRNYFSLYGFLLALFFIALLSCFAKKIMKILDKYPQRLFIFIMILGGVSAFFIPQFLYSFKYIGETKDITTALLTVTGGVLAIFTLLKTHQKNILDKDTLEFERAKYAKSIENRNQDIAEQEKLRQEQKNQFNITLAQQKNKDFQEHIRQVHAERRARYAKAIEQLADNKAAIRLGGIYTLVGLVDEWLADDALDEKPQQKEGQVIINNLCAYIQSPFKLATKAKELEADTAPDTYDKEQFIADKAELHEEQNVRRTIFDEMSKRSSTIKDTNAKIFTPIPGPWSNFDFNFSRAPIFYPLNNLKIEKARFAGATFYTDAKFDEVLFIGDANFKKATFTSNASFIWATFATTESYLGANFREATFNGAANFTQTKFIGSVFFSNATFNGTADFRWPEFRNDEPRFVIGDERAKFSARLNPKDNNFLTTPGDKTIDLGEATLLGKTFNIPLGTVLFDPDSPKDQLGNYAVQSEPAKPIEESDNQGETPSK